MKTQKRRLELLSFYDHTGIERHLTKMAEKGWIIEKISNGFWTYRRTEPQKLHFTVSYFARASDFDPAPSQGQQTLIDLCQETGWELVCTWFQMQVFCHRGEDPIPIHTEPALEVEEIYRACRKRYLPICAVTLLFSLVMTFFFFSSLISDTLRLLASSSEVTVGLCFLILFLLCLADLATYGTWHARAKKAAEQGIFLDTPSTSGIQRAALAAVALCIVYWLVSLFLVEKGMMAWIFLAVLLCTGVTVFLVNTIKGRLKKRSVPSGVNRGVTVLACFLIPVLLVHAAGPMGSRLMADMGWSHELTHTPLEVSDLRETAYNNYLTTTSLDESLFLARLEAHQQPGFGDEPGPDIPELGYEIYVVKLPALYDFCRDQLNRLTVLSAFWKGRMEEQDAAPWGAEEAYRLIWDDGTGADEYVLCYPDRLVRIAFSWEPTEEQMGAVGEKLTGRELV